MRIFCKKSSWSFVFAGLVAGIFALGMGGVGCSDDDSGGVECGNGLCQLGEDYESCPEDCSCGDGVCDGVETAMGCPEDCACGNGILNGGEACDGEELDGATCESLGFQGGSLSCTSVCAYDTSGCTDITAQVTLLHTSDVHHHASGYGPFAEYTPLDTSDDDPLLGGFARLASLMNQIRQDKSGDSIPVLVFDSADYFMGTVYDMTLMDPIGLKFFQLVGYDAITIGNHEWDWSPAGLAMLYQNAMDNGGFSVPIVASNMILSTEDEGDDGIEGLVNAGAIHPKMIMELPNGLKVGVLGLLGPEAHSLTPMATPVDFVHTPGHIQVMVDELREQDEVHMVVVLSHGGIYGDGSGDDAELAESVDGIDVILSGHYHRVTPQPFEINDTLVYGVGEYGEWLSQLDVTFNVSHGMVEDYTFTNHPIDDSIVGDATVQGLVEGYHAALDMQLQSALGVSVASPIVEVPFDLEAPSGGFYEVPLAGLCADALRFVATGVAMQTGDASPNYTLAVAPYGTLRDGLYSGNLGYATFADIYNVMPMGISPDPENQTAPGYPLCSAWLTAEEIKQVAEVPVTVAPSFQNSDIFLGISGIRVEYDSTGQVLPPARVQTVYECGSALSDPYSMDCSDELDTDPSNTRLYRVVTDLYTLLMMRIVAQAQLNIQPKFADGTVIDLTNMEEVLQTRIDLDGNPGNGIQEIKVWTALLNYVTEAAVFPDDGGIPGMGEIPGYYDPADMFMPRFVDVN